jgi:hypothetical protein
MFVCSMTSLGASKQKEFEQHEPTKNGMIAGVP